MYEYVNNRKEKFFEQLNLSEATARNYRNALNSTFLKGKLYSELGVMSLFEITDLNTLWDFYTIINVHPKNISNHRSYSAAVMKYIRFLNNGNKVGRRIDYNKKRKFSANINKEQKGNG